MGLANMEIRMTPSEILGGLLLMQDRIKEKGYYMPSACIKINWLSFDLTLVIETQTEAGGGYENKYIHTSIENGFESLFVKADEYVSKMQSIQEAKRNDFIASIGRLIDKGREIGIEVEFMNPLTEMMGKLSTNIIEHKE